MLFDIYSLYKNVQAILKMGVIKLGKKVKTKLVKKTFLIPETLNKALKLKCLDENKKMTEVIVEALNKYLSNGTNIEEVQEFKNNNRRYDNMVNEFNKGFIAEGLRLIASGIENIAKGIEIQSKEDLDDYVERNVVGTTFTLDECGTFESIKGFAKGMFKKVPQFEDENEE